ncbi:MAG: 50S ribosomal protein L11 [Patescibacteria group bacterium]|jgi:large subunit ribosomal protein L11
MAKEIKALIKLNLAAGAATAAPPAGPALGQHGVPIMDFIKQYNEATKNQKGQIIPVVITVYKDRSFTFVTKLPPVAEMIKQKLGIKKGSGVPNKDKVGTLSKKQVTEIAEAKLKDLNATTVAAAEKVVAGTARSMGVDVTN